MELPPLEEDVAPGRFPGPDVLFEYRGSESRGAGVQELTSVGYYNRARA